MINGKYKLVAETQEIGYSAWGTLDYAFQATSFEAYENLTWEDNLILDDLGENGVGTIYLVPAKDQLTEERYMLHIQAIEDITDEEDEEIGTDYLWRTSLYKEVA
jgi:hypothetical protein